MKKRFSEEEVKFLSENYIAKGIEFCAAQLQRSANSIKYKARELGLKIYNSFPNIDTDQFEKIDSPEIAYFLGLMWADGYVGGRTVSIEMVRDDLEEIKYIFEHVGKWYEYRINTLNSKSGNPERERLKLGRYNKKFAEYFKKLGFREKSTGVTKEIIDKIPEYLRHYFWRGFLDGDGCIFIRPNGYPTITFAGPVDCDWFCLETLLIKLKVKFSTDKIHTEDNGSSSRVVINNFDGCKKIMKYIYKDRANDSIGLSRKYQKYLTATKECI